MLRQKASLDAHRFGTFQVSAAQKRTQKRVAMQKFCSLVALWIQHSLPTERALANANAKSKAPLEL
jgi:hypothetical protein